eukprot:7653375-Pyramimonas_sp.AAC.1
MRPNACGSPCGSGTSLLSPLTGRFPCTAWRLRATMADIAPWPAAQDLAGTVCPPAVPPAQGLEQPRTDPDLRC